jgi:flagellar hook-associated protein 2
MATSSISSTSTTATLNSTYTSLLNSIMTAESKPLTKLNTKKDTVEVQKAVYTDLLTNLKSLQTSIEALISTDSSYGIKTGKATSVSNATNDSTVFSATSTDDALLGSYDIAVSSLAKQHRVTSSRQASSLEALGLTGQIVVGGSLVRSQTAVSTIAGMLDTFGTAEIASDTTELSSGNYYVETRHDSTAGWQFRVVDAYGNAVSVRQSSGSYSGNWQAINGSTYDTGRGLTINFGSDTSAYQTTSKGSGAAQVKFAAKGVSLDVSSGQSLQDIAKMINSATYVAGNEVTASVIDQQLVLTAKNSGTAHSLEVSGNVMQSLGVVGSDGLFSHELNAATDAVFTVNNMSITRSSNSGIEDVIPGVTLNLASDAEGESATLTIGSDGSAATTAISSFISQYNNIQTYLTNKTALTKVSDTQYTRGALTGQTSITSLRTDLISQFDSKVTTSGIYTRLKDIGLSIDDKFQISISDSSKLTSAVQNHLSDVKALLDAKMGKMDTTLKAYTGTSGIVTMTSENIDDQIDQIDDRIESMEEKLAKRKDTLTTQYLAIQAQMSNYDYLEQQMSLFASYNLYGTSG